MILYKQPASPAKPEPAMNTTAEDTASIAVAITLTRADHLAPAERQALLQAFRNNLQIVLGGPEALHKTLQEQYTHADGPGPDRQPPSDGEPQGTLRRAFMVADYTTWMGRDRPLGARFGIQFRRATVN